MGKVKQIERLFFNVPPVDGDFLPPFADVEGDTQMIIDQSPTADDYKRQLDPDFKKENSTKKTDNHPPNYSNKKTEHLQKGKFYPLIIMFIFLLGGTALLNISRGWNSVSYFIDVVGFYLLLQSFLIFIDHKQFISAFKKVDPIAKKHPSYSKLFPFLLLIASTCLLSRSLTEVWLLLAITLLTVHSFGVLSIIIREEIVKSTSLGALLFIRLDEKNLIENSIIVLLAAFAILLS